MSVIAFDFDDVLVPTAPYFAERYNNTYGTNVLPQDNYSGNLEPWGVSSVQEVATRFIELVLNPECSKITPRPETVEAITQLSQNHQLHIVTGRPESAAEVTQRIIDEYFAGLFTSVNFTSYNLPGATTKAEVCQKIGAQFLVEDNTEHALNVARAGITAILFGNYAWNQLTELPPKVVRAANWQQVLELVT